MDKDQYLTVSQLSHYIKAKFTRDPYLERVLVRGEVSNYRKRPNGHQYFSLKDDNALIAAVMFKNQFQKLKFDLEVGMNVYVVGHVGVYEGNGSYHIYIDDILPDGLGQLYQAFEQLKEKLAKEGLFDFDHKAIPSYPKRIAVVTSESGAVIRDIITTVKRRYPIVQLDLYPSQVQGAKAKDSLVANLKRIAQNDYYDLVIIGRGGGSIEDLWPFNEEIVVRQVAAMPIPVISSVGHETDTTLVDYVADVRAATPTAAAEIATPVLRDILLKIKDWQRRIYQTTNQEVLDYRKRLMKLQSAYFFKEPQRLYEIQNLRLGQVNQDLLLAFKGQLTEKKECLNKQVRGLDQASPKEILWQAQKSQQSLQRDLHSAIRTSLTDQSHRLQALIKQLDALSPLKVLGKGYAFLANDQGPVHSVSQIDIGDRLKIHLADGKIYANVTASSKNKPKKE